VRPLVVVALACAACSSGQPKAEVIEPYATFRELHELVVTPTCGPRGGVCHNSKQFPDLHTPENMLAAVGQRCNQLTDDPLAIVDECEEQGDLLVIHGGPDAGLRTRIGYVTVDSAMPPAFIELTTRDPIPHDGSALVFGIVRDSDPTHPIEVPFPAVLATTAGQRKVTVALGKTAPLSPSARAFLTNAYVPGNADQVQLGDPNRNGTFGFELGFLLIKPGDVSKSFLVQRITGAIPPRMPLANGDLTSEQIYALQCWITQLAPDGSNADGPIDYARCPR
jgi:hypothetical protein